MNRKGVNMFDTLNKRADYAINSKSRSLVYQTYGECLMASELGAITANEFTALNTRLVRNTMNNGQLWNTFHC